MLLDKGMRIDTSRGHLPLLCSGQQFYRRFARCSIRPRTERFVNAFLCNDPLPTSDGHALLLPNGLIKAFPFSPLRQTSPLLEASFLARRRLSIALWAITDTSVVFPEALNFENRA